MISGDRSCGDESEEQFEEWLSQFNARMEQKETANRQVEWQRNLEWERVADKWHEYHVGIARRAAEAEKMEAQRKLNEEAAAAKALAEETDLDRIRRLTADMTDEEAKRFVDLENEWKAVSEDYRAREERMTRVDSEIRSLVAFYEQRLATEAEQRRRAEEEQQRIADEFAEQLRLQRMEMENEAAIGHDAVATDECADRKELEIAEFQARSTALLSARSRILENLPTEVTEMAPTEQTALEEFLDEHLQLDVLRAKLKRLMKDKR